MLKSKYIRANIYLEVFKMIWTTIERLSDGDLFTLQPISKPSESQIFVRGGRVKRSSQYYGSQLTDLSSARKFKKGTPVYVGFVY